MSALHEAEETYRRMAYDTFARDLKMGFNLGFCRTFAVPEIARVLASTGRMTQHTRVRAKATGAMMYGLFEHGLDSERGAETIAALGKLHAPFAIGDDAFRYVLACFDLAPMRWCAAHAWRAPTDAERAASHTLYLGLAERLGISEVPATWREFETWTQAYERAHFATTPEGRELWQATRGMLADRVPGVLGPLAGAAADSLLDDLARDAFGAPRPPALVRGATRAALRARAWRGRRAHARAARARAEG
ncbi:oxygenase MpaB family protein [Streptomyces himastatinicus]|uniref:oxygenase MpaB family protein n=1 Tax=Streptomyces himastatinicus TaxID=998084 RepID=UPI000A311999|nr:oxygenase MpaB family protein [Streptomyces himastatinicus]